MHVVVSRVSGKYQLTTYDCYADIPSDPSHIVIASFNDTIDSNGWSTIEIASARGVEVFSDTELAYAAGFVGSMTRCYPYIPLS